MAEGLTSLSDSQCTYIKVSFAFPDKALILVILKLAPQCSSRLVVTLQCVATARPLDRDTLSIFYKRHREILTSCVS